MSNLHCVHYLIRPCRLQPAKTAKDLAIWQDATAQHQPIGSTLSYRLLLLLSSFERRPVLRPSRSSSSSSPPLLANNGLSSASSSSYSLSFPLLTLGWPTDREISTSQRIDTQTDRQLNGKQDEKTKREDEPFSFISSPFILFQPAPEPKPISLLHLEPSSPRSSDFNAAAAAAAASLAR